MQRAVRTSACRIHPFYRVDKMRCGTFGSVWASAKGRSKVEFSFVHRGVGIDGYAICNCSLAAMQTSRTQTAQINSQETQKVSLDQAQSADDCSTLSLNPSRHDRQSCVAFGSSCRQRWDACQQYSMSQPGRAHPLPIFGGWERGAANQRRDMGANYIIGSGRQGAFWQIVEGQQVAGDSEVVLMKG